MSIIVHEREGVLFKNRDGSFSGAIMLDGKTYDLSGSAGKSAGGIEYIQITARERGVPSGQSIPSVLPGRSRRLEQCAKADIAKYAVGHKR